MQKEINGKNKQTFFQKAIAIVKRNKKIEYGVYAFIALVVIVLYANGFSSKPDGSDPVPDTAAKATTIIDTETRLREVLSKIRGAGKVEVMITYETGTELVTAMSTNINNDASQSSDGSKSSSTQKTTESAQPATVSGSSGNKPIILMEKEPIVRGVIIVAEGAADINVKLDLQRAVKAVLDIPLSNIEVFEAAENRE